MFSFLLKPKLLTFLFAGAASLRSSLGLAALALIVLLKEALLNIAEVVVLEAGQLDQLLGPDRLDTRELPPSGSYTTRYKILVCVDQLMVLH